MLYFNIVFGSFIIGCIFAIVNYNMCIRKNFSKLTTIIWSISGFIFPMLSTFILMGVQSKNSGY